MESKKEEKLLILAIICMIIFANLFLWSCFELRYSGSNKINNKNLFLANFELFRKETRNRNVNLSLANSKNQTSTLPKVFCFIMTIKDGNLIKRKAVRETWGKRCDKLLFITSNNNNNNNNNNSETVEIGDLLKVPIKFENRSELWHKIIFTIEYLYKNYLNNYDWFFKADDDTYVLMENLIEFLNINSSPNEPVYYGHKFKKFVKQGYMSGGSGYALSRKALKLLYEIGFNNNNDNCHLSFGSIEDVEIGNCLELSKVKAGDTRDKQGKQTFFPLTIDDYMLNNSYLFNKNFWYLDYTYYPIKENNDCCSNKPISFHYIKPKTMYLIDWLLYKVEKKKFN